MEKNDFKNYIENLIRLAKDCQENCEKANEKCQNNIHRIVDNIDICENGKEKCDCIYHKRLYELSKDYEKIIKDFTNETTKKTFGTFDETFKGFRNIFTKKNKEENINSEEIKCKKNKKHKFKKEYKFVEEDFDDSLFDFKNLQEDYDDLKEDFDNLKEDLDDLQEDFEYLKDELEDLKEEFKDLKRDFKN
ncbi:hypothetical protein STABA_v1c04210 [Spiroplasma tabanidicola]|uniref:Uncharacterized protein n=2 Tax=Spiroplasma tabanidicola TaxID=324079 RepID=A0A6I6CCU0_9MOLU|nr:hypothetical protein STABA_v1c04210 [Spiroplasma tabanidicola]